MSYVSQQGVLHSQTQPLVTAGISAVQAMTRVLGVSNVQYPHNPDDANPVETLSIQRILEGKNEYNGFSIISMMESANPVLLQLFPMKPTNTLTHIQEFYDFPKEFAVETAPGSAPGYSKSAKTQKSYTLTQYRFGAKTTLQELRTEEGMFVWYGKLIVLAIAFIEVAEMLVIKCLLEVPTYYAEYYVKTGLHEIDLARAGRMHDMFFDILHRRENGMAELLNAVRDDMSKSRAIEPTHLIIAEMIGGLAITQRHLEYYRNGPGAAENAVKLSDAFPSNYDGLEIVKVRALNYREKQLTINLLERYNVQIGQNFCIDNFHVAADLAKYTSAWMTIAVYSMETDNWAYIGIDEAINACGRFHKADGYLEKWHHTLAKGWRSMTANANVPVMDNRVDMFIYEAHNPATNASSFQVATVWGQMERWALSDGAIDRTALTIANYLERTVGATAIAEISAGLENITELHEKTLDAAKDTPFITKATTAPNGKFGVPSIALLLATDADRDAVGAKYKPAGYGTVPGYFEVAEGAAGLDEDLVAQARNFKKAAIAFHTAVKSLFGNEHVAIDPRYAPSVFRPSGSLTTQQSLNYLSLINLFQNIVDSNKLAIAKAEANRQDYFSNAVPAVNGVAQPRQAKPDGVDPKTSYPLSSIQASVARNQFENLLTDGGFVPEIVARNFFTLPATNAFLEAYKNSPFAKSYADFQRGLRAVRSRTAVADGLEAPPVAPANAADREFAKFIENELVGLSSNSVQSSRLLSRVVAAVQNNEQVTVNNELLRAWRGSTLGDKALSADGSDKFVPTALSVSLASATDNAINFVSPFNTGEKLDKKKADKDGTGVNNDLLRTTYHIQSKDRLRPQPAQKTMPLMQPPTFASKEFTDTVGGDIVVNTTIVDRFRDAANKPNWLLRVAEQLLLLAPISRDTLLSFVKNNVMPPVAFVLEQPWRRYRTSSGIFVSKPAAPDVLGNVLIMDPACTTGIDAIRADFMMNVSMYMGAAPIDCQNWYVAHDIAVSGYDGGETATLYDLSHRDILNHVMSGARDGASILAFMVPAGSTTDKYSATKIPPTHDIRGYRNQAYYQANSKERNSIYANQPMIPSSPYYTTWLNLNTITTFDARHWKDFQPSHALMNTITHRGLQLVIDTHTQQHDRVIKAQDAFGDAVYPGCRELRESLLPMQYKDMGYAARAIPGL
jgi:hypothetical protein